MNDVKRINLKQFAQQIQELFEEPDARVIWFIGAGCSMSSGIPGAAALVEQWLPRLKKRETGDSADWSGWAGSRFPEYSPDNPGAHYGSVMDELFLQVTRQKEMERVTSGRDPAVGYALLAQLMTNDRFGSRCNIVLTTNFDDLVADGLYLTTTQKPLVVGHDSLARFARASESRPLVVKLHGDALLAPRNTVEEVSELDPSLAQSVARLLDNCAIVFLGYAGRDQSIARLFATLPEGSVSYGMYWVGSALPGTLMQDELERHPSFHVDHRDFDEAMVEIADLLDVKLPGVKRWKELFKRYERQLTSTAGMHQRRVAKGEGSADSEATFKAASRLRDSAESARLSWEAWDYRDNEPDKAEKLYQRALEADPAHPETLGDFASFMTDVRKDHDRAEELYERSLDADPTDATTLGNYANFVTDVRKDHDRAEQLYEKALDADPSDANALGNYARFVADVRKDHDRAEELYERSLDADPTDATTLGNYADFVTYVRIDHDRAEELYERALDTDPTDVNALGNYAFFMQTVREDHDRAEELYERALDVDPADADTLGVYAYFIHSVRGDHTRAEELFQAAIDSDPMHANSLANYAQLLLMEDRVAEGLALIKKAIDEASIRPGLLLEIEFYVFVHDPDNERDAEGEMKRLISEGERSPGWDFSGNVRWARDHEASNIDLIETLADVISGKANVASLAAFLGWEDVGSSE